MSETNVLKYTDILCGGKEESVSDPPVFKALSSVKKSHGASDPSGNQRRFPA